MKTTFFICAIIFSAMLAPAQISGPLNPSSFSNADLSGYNQQWVNINNVALEDENYATFGDLNGGLGSHTDYLVATNFGFNFLPGTIILGIVVEVECSDPNLRTSEYSVRIVKTGFISSTEKASGRAYTASDKYMIYGGPSDLWGETWDYKFINDNQFGVAISAQRNTNDAVPTDGKVNNIRVTVYYTFHTLPLQLTSFTASKNNNTKTTKLQWTTASEINLDRYEVQRSSDGRNFQTINSIAGRNQNCNADYSCVDNNPLSGISFYRLKMIGISGDEKYSKIVRVEFQSNEFSLYPSILGQGENLYVTNNNHSPIQISFFDNAGKKLSTITTDNIEVPLKKLSLQQGVIIYKIFNSLQQEVGNGRIVIQ